MKIGYARTSTLEQLAGFEAQLRDLKAAGCEKIYQEQVSAVDTRAQFEAAVDFARDGDSLIVTNLFRFARSVRHALDVIDQLGAKGVALVILDLNLDTRTATGEMLMTVLLAVAQMERKLMLERQREGVAKAKALGKYRGRKPTARAKEPEIRALKAEGLGPSAIAKKLNIHRASVYRVLAG